MTALFGEVADVQIARAMTAIVASGLASRAQSRSRCAAGAAFRRGGWAALGTARQHHRHGRDHGPRNARVVRFRRHAAARAASACCGSSCRIADRIGWLAATPDLELRAISADLALPLDGIAAGSARIVLHDARVFGQSFERLVIGNVADAAAVLPGGARAACRGHAARHRGPARHRSLALANLLNALGITAANGGVVATAVDQLAFDPAGLVRQRLAAAGAQMQAAVASLLGPLAAGIDLAARRVRVQGGGATSGRFGWAADLTASLDGPTPGLSGTLAIGPDSSAAHRGWPATACDSRRRRRTVGRAALVRGR